MAKSWNLVFVLVWLSLLIAAGIHLFSKGFLLTRVAQTEFSTCVRYEDYRCDSTKGSCSGTKDLLAVLHEANQTAEVCLPRKSKVIFLLIDALRYDFGEYNASNRHPAAYQNNLPILSQLLNKHPKHSRKLKFIADPPTTTLQRLKGMTTGSLPTFIDIGSNFATPEINEDNIVDQIVRSGLSAVFLGDNTWTELFPNRFKRKFDFPSFNIYDLDTVDTAIERLLPREINRGDWDVMIAHFLGVDHCGHRYGPLHDEMRRKLQEMNEVIRNVTEQMDDGTTLIVVGDHGMTQSGDHGGETSEEVDALLFMYSKGTPLMGEEYDEYSGAMQQIDLVPTLATILGIPIPYSNLGQIIFQLIPDVPVDGLQPYQRALLHLWQNARQIQRYFQRYAETNQGIFSVEQLDDLENKLLILTQRGSTIYTKAAFQSFTVDLRLYLKDILDSCREIWVKFDHQLISHGLLITFLGCFAIFILIVSSSAQQMGQIFHPGVIQAIGALTLIAGTSGYFFHKEFGLGSAEHGIIFISATGSVLVLAFLTIQNWTSIADNLSNVRHTKNVVTRVCFVFTTCTFFANSFIVQEQKILCYLIVGFFLYALYQLQTGGNSLLKFPRLKFGLLRKSIFVYLLLLTLFATALIRFSSHYFRCREEQGNCTDYLVKAPTAEVRSRQKASFNSNDIVPIVALALYVVCARMYLQACGNLTGNSVNVLLARYGPTVGAVCTCGHFVVAKGSPQGIPQIHVDALAWVVYCLLVAQVITLLAIPLMVYILPKRKEIFNVLQSDRSVASEIYKQLRQNFGTKGTSSQGAAEIPIVCGLATVYSSVFIALGVFLSILLAILLGSHGTMGLVVVIAVAVAYGIVASILQYETATNLATCVQPTFTSLLMWIILQQYGFYATAHQPTLSQIEWNAAFTGRTYYFDNSNLISALLVLLNTFSTTFLLSVLFPVIIFMPFCIYNMWPSLAEKRSHSTPLGGSGTRRTTRDNMRTVVDGNVEVYRSVTVAPVEDDSETVTTSVDFNITKGEINLYENERLFLGTAFKTGCQLLLIQSIRIFCAMFACTIHCRHLMVWKIFAPRFIYEGIASYVAFAGLNIGFLVLLRVHRAVGGLITAINRDR